MICRRSASPKFEGRATRSPSPGFEASVRKRSASPKFEGRATRSSSPGFEASVRKRSASPRVRHGGRPGKGRSFSPVLDVGARKRSQSPRVQDKRPETVEEQPSGSSKQRRPEGEGTLLPLGEINIARVVETCLPFTELPWKSGKTHSNNMLGHKSRDAVRGKNVCLGFLHGKDPPQNLVRSSWHASFPSPFLRAPH